jgi:hypothetical protein
MYIYKVYIIYIFKFTGERERVKEIEKDTGSEKEDVLCTLLQQDDLINTAINHGWQWRIYLT